jgi:hypothetical protein
MLRLNKLDVAKDWYLDRIDSEPHNSLLHNNLGVCFEGLRDIKSALESYKRAAELYANLGANENDKRYNNGFYNLMRLLQAEDDYPMLELVAKTHLKIDPKNVIATYYLGSSRIYLRKYISAKELLENVIKRDKTSRKAHLDLSFLLDSITHEYKYAIRILEDYIRNNDTNDERIANNLAFAYIKDGQLEKAKAILDDTNFQTPITTATRGLFEYYIDNYEMGNKKYLEAIKSVENKVGKKDAKQVWRYEQASYWYRKENYAKSWEYVEKAIKLGEDSFAYADILALKDKLKLKKQPTSLNFRDS